MYNEQNCKCSQLPTPRLDDVIVSEIVRGEGTEESRSRRVIQFHCVHGTFLAENDPATKIAP